MEVRESVGGPGSQDRELKAMESVLGALQPLDAAERRRVLTWLTAKFGVGVSSATTDSATAGGNAPGYSPADIGGIKPFVKHKKPGDDVARVTTLAYFLTHRGQKPTYKTADLTKARVDAALPAFNTSRAVSHAQRAGYLTTAGRRGTYQVTSTGEALVEAMPDNARVQEVRAQGGRRRRRSGASTRAAAKATTKKP